MRRVGFVVWSLVTRRCHSLTSTSGRPVVPPLAPSPAPTRNVPLLSSELGVGPRGTEGGGRWTWDRGVRGVEEVDAGPRGTGSGGDGRGTEGCGEWRRVVHSRARTSG